MPRSCTSSTTCPRSRALSGRPDDGAGARRLPRRGQCRGARGPAPGRPERGRFRWGRPGRGDLRRRPVPRLPGPAAGDVVRARPLRGLRRPAAAGAAAARQRRDAVPAPARTRAGQPLGGVRAGGARGRRAAEGDPDRLDGFGADGGAAHPADRGHPARQRPRPACRVPARGAASCGSRAAPSRCSRCGWGSGATRCSVSSRTSRTTWRSWTTPRPRWSCSSGSSWPVG